MRLISRAAKNAVFVRRRVSAAVLQWRQYTAATLLVSMVFGTTGAYSGPRANGFHTAVARHLAMPHAALPQIPASLARASRFSAARGLHASLSKVLPRIHAFAATTTGSSSISANFNGFSMPAGTYIWFSSILQASGTNQAGTTIFIPRPSIQFTANGQIFHVTLPDSKVVYSSSAATATTTFDAAKGRWLVTVPVGYTGNVFFDGTPYLLPVTMPGGFDRVTFTSTFYTDTPGVQLSWHWEGQPYPQFTSSNGALGVKAVDGSGWTEYANNDKAGTPENYKQYVQGGNGGGAANFVGSPSAPGSVQSLVEQPPVANAGPDQTLALNAKATLDGSRSSDTNGNPLTYSWSLLSVPTGSAAQLSDPTDVKPTFTIDKQGSYVAQLVVNDGMLDSAPAQVVISNTNSAPFAIAGPDQPANIGKTVQLDGSKSYDPDGDALHYHWTLSSPSGSASILNDPTIARPTFVPDVPGTYVATLIVDDGQVNSARPATTTVSSSALVPIANAGSPQSGTVWTLITLDGTKSYDPNGLPLTYQWTLTTPAGSNAKLSDPTAPQPTFTIDKQGTYVAQLIVSDAYLSSDPTAANSTVTISTINSAPVANAGANQTSVVAGTVIQLDGSKSFDVDGDMLTFAWSFASVPIGSSRVFSDPTAVTPTFVTDQVGEYVVQLTVNDGQGGSSSATVLVTSNDIPPVANAGPQQRFDVGNTVTLDGSASTASFGHSLTYKWWMTPPTGSNAVLLNANAVSPSFVADVLGTYTLYLQVNDGYLDSNVATLTLAANNRPTADAGPPQILKTGDTIQLDGSASNDVDADPLTYRWSITSHPLGSVTTFDDPTIAKPTILGDVAGTYVFQLIVNDGLLDSTPPATVMITVNIANQPPVVSSGPDQTVTFPAATQLQGSVTDDGLPKGAPLTILWTEVSGPGNAAFANAADPATTVGFDKPGTYVLKLSANDSEFESDASVTISVQIPQNQPPTVNAGPNDSAIAPAIYQLQGSATDDGFPLGSKLTVAWSQVSGPDVAIFSMATSATSSVRLNSAGTYVLMLTASDGQQSASSSVTITTTLGNTPPVVNAGPDQTIRLGEEAALQGSAIDDGLPQGSVLVYSWSRVTGPGNVVFSTTNGPSTIASFDAAGTYTLRLSASDSQLSGSADVHITVMPANQAPIVSAGPDQTLTILSNVSSLPLVPTLLTISSGFNSEIGLDYHQPTNELVTSVFYPNGQPHNFELIDPQGNHQQFSNVSGLGDEVYIATARDEGSGFSIGGFLAGEMFTGSGAPGVIVRISPDGTTVQNPWVRLPNETGLLRGQLYIDRTGVFGGDLLVVTTSGNLWRVTSAGVPALIGSGFGDCEGLLSVPNDPHRYGPWAGKIITGSENLSRIYAVDVQGNINYFNIGIAPENIKLISPNENFFVADYARGTLMGIPASELSGMDYDILMGDEFSGILWQVHWNGNSFVTSYVATVPGGMEGSTFAPAGIKEVSPTTVTAALQGTISDDGLPQGAPLTVQWSQVSGPGIASFSSPTSLSTSATFSIAGTYVLRLTGTDTQLSSSSDVSIKIAANQPPQVSPGNDQQIAFPATAQLSGSATDDGLPVGGHLATFWTKVTGAGRVNFSVPTSSAADDFSATNNPNGMWSYGWIPTRGGAFTLYSTSNVSSNALSGWYATSVGSVPQLLANFNSNTVYSVPPGAIAFYPGASGQNSVARWTAPATNSYLIQGQFYGVSSGCGSTSSDVSVLLNSSTAILSGYVQGSTAVPFSFVKAMNQGDKLDFSVGYGTDNSNYCDSTILSANITPASSPQSTASFTSPGDYTLRLTAYDSELFSFNDVHVTSTTSCVQTPSGMVAWLPGDGDTRNLLGNAGVVEGNVSYAPGEVGEGFSLAGSGDVVVPATTFNSQSFALDAWIFTLDLQSRPILEFSGPSSTLGVNLWTNLDSGANYSPGTLYANIIDTNGNSHPLATPLGTLQQKTWTHVALTYNNNNGMATIYVNGIAQTSVSLGSFTPQTSVPTIIGGRESWVTTQSGKKFFGTIDEVGMFNRALSPAEVLSLYTAGASGQCKPNGTLPPLVSAGLDQTLTLPATQLSLNGSASDPNGQSLTLAWSVASGPGPVAFSSPAAANTNASFTWAGNYVLRLSATDLQQSASSTVNVAVVPGQNLPPIVSVASVQPIQLPTNTATLSATASDDGLPLGSHLTYQWSLLSGPGSVTFATPTQLSTPATFSAAGTYLIRFAADDSELTGSADLTITVVPVQSQNQPPVVTVSGPQTIQLPIDSATLSATVTDDGLPSGSLSVNWLQLSGPAKASFADPTRLSTGVVLPIAGTYVFELVANDSALTASGQTSVTVLPLTNPPPPPPVVAITSPSQDVDVTKPITFIGSISSGTWTLQYASAGDNDPESTQLNWTTLASGSGPASNATLGTFDPTVMLNGTYYVRLISTDNSNQSSSTSLTVTVDRNLKVGNFSLSFNDLSVPMPGLPIQVTRTYDSRNHSVGDFGYGWTLSIANVRVSKSSNFGQGWYQDVTWIGNFPQYCLTAPANRRVTFTFPDGKVYKFLAGSSPQCQQYEPIQAPQMSFTQQPTDAATAGASLAVDGAADTLVSGDVPGPVDLIDYNGNYFDATKFLLTTADGYIYSIDQTAGVTKVQDTNGNYLTITPTGVTHSSGQSVAFVRDSQGRITSIQDPRGQSIVYSYSSTGDLQSVTDRASNSTTFYYDLTHPHYLDDIKDPRGIDAVKNTYDDSGRLVATTDASGNTITYNHALAQNQEAVTNRLGNVTVYTYDDDGNIVETDDPQGGSSFATYDSMGNKLSEWNNVVTKPATYTYDALGNRLSESDALGHKTTYAYNSHRQVTDITDANGNHTQNSYDVRGNLISTVVVGSGVNPPTYQYGANGLPSQVTDAIGATTKFTYDGNGNVLTQTDATGNTTTYTYDGNGNKRSQSVQRTKSDGTQETLVTSFAYDSDNRLTQTTYPDQSTTKTTYNSIGKQTDTYDANNHHTQYAYDANGRLTGVTYQDGTSEAYTYDAEGHKLSSVDRGGHETDFVYDKAGRLTQTIAKADGASTQTIYDVSGRVLQSVDANGHATTYTYDDAGRRISVTDALGHVTSFEYDAAGNQTAVTDANLRTTYYTYDAMNRRTAISYADGTTERSVYDGDGRVTDKYDQAGKHTRYVFDGIGRLTDVYLAPETLNLHTAYGYDEIGDRVAQTDANGHVTSFAYDGLGRRVRRTLPLGQTESYAYDATGNLAVKTDFNGNPTHYFYDSANRLLCKTPSATADCTDARAVNFTYTADGRRATMTDPSGQTLYSYDAHDRLLAKQTPFGTLSYTYDAAGDLLTTSSSNVDGANVAYTYDALNRLATVTDNDAAMLGTVTASGSTTVAYGYDAAGNLATAALPNGVTASYTYDLLNRLTHLAATTSNSALASYVYTLGPAGNRTGVSELNERTVQYGYDDVYRLTGETISGASSGSTPQGSAAAQNGAIEYQYDSVGNRLALSSTVPAVPAGMLNYDANDRLTTDTYDANGNTLSSAGVDNTYDFEDHLVQHGAVSIVYDGDGNRVAKTAGGVTTQYLVDTNNPTGYAQVLDELQAGKVTRTYTYGLDRISENQPLSSSSGSTWQLSYYGYDGHGSLRYLMNTAGAVTDTYDYDAFGNLISSTGTTPNNYLYSGEQYDPDLHLYYNRARYLDVRNGRFWGMDTFEGKTRDPLSLHMYLYVAGNPASLVDPSGHDFDLGSLAAAGTAFTTLATTAFVTFQTVAGAIYLNLYKIPEVVETASNYGAVGLGSFEALRMLGTNVLNYAESYSRGPVIRGNQFEEAAGANLGRTFPAIDYYDANSGVAVQIRSTTQTQSPDALLAVVRRGVNRLNNLPPELRGQDRAGDPLAIEATDIKEKGLLVGIPAKPLPWFPMFLQRVKDLSESEKVTITIQFVEGLEGETIEK